MRMKALTVGMSGGLAEVKFHRDQHIIQFTRQSVNDFLLKRMASDSLIKFPLQTLSVEDMIGCPDLSVGLQGSCILFLDPDRFDLTVGGRRQLF
jgi:hypothetical protein